MALQEPAELAAHTLLHDSSTLGPLAALTAAVSLGVAIFFALYSLVPVTRADVPQLGSLFLGTMMAFVMGVQALTPMLVRRLSLRRVLAGSAALMAAGALITGTSTNTLTLLVGAVAGGAGFGVLIVAGAQGVALLVPANRLGRALGIYGLITMASAALGAPAGVHLALASSPSAFGIGAFVAGIIASGLSLWIPGAVGRAGAGRTRALALEPCPASSDVTNTKQPLLKFAKNTPWLVLLFLLLGIVVLSHGLSSLPVMASTYANAAIVIFSVQAGNALGRWLGGELEAKAGTGITIMAGAALGSWAAGPAMLFTLGALMGLGVGIIQTVTLHTAMRLMDVGGASVMWNLAVDGGLWTGGILWGLALTSGFVEGGVLLLSAMVVGVGVMLVLQLRGKLQ